MSSKALLLKAQGNVLKLSKNKQLKRRANVTDLKQQKRQRWWEQYSLRRKPQTEKHLYKYTFALQFTAFWSTRVWQVCWGDVQLTKDADGAEYIHFSERQTKIRSGANPHNVRPIKPRALATPGLSLELDSKERRVHEKTWDAPFHLGVQKTLMKVGSKPMQWELTILTVWWNHGWKSRSWQLSPYEQQRSKTNDSNTELYWYSSWSYNAVFWAQKLTTEVIFHKKKQKSMSRLLRASTSMVHPLVETPKSSADSSRAIQRCCDLQKKFHHQYQLVLVLNRSMAHKEQTYNRMKQILDSSDDDSPLLT